MFVSGPFFSNPDPVFKIRVRFRVTPKRPDLTGSWSGSYLYMFLMFSKINIFFYGIFIPNRNILWYFFDNVIQLENYNYRDKGSEFGSGFSPAPDPSDPKRPDPHHTVFNPNRYFVNCCCYTVCTSVADLVLSLPDSDSRIL